MNTVNIFVTVNKAELKANINGKEINKTVYSIEEVDSYSAKALLQQLKAGMDSLKSENFKVEVTLRGKHTDVLEKQFKWLPMQSRKNFVRKDGQDIFLAPYWRKVFSNNIALNLLQKGYITFSVKYEKNPNYAGD